MLPCSADTALDPRFIMVAHRTSISSFALLRVGHAFLFLEDMHVREVHMVNGDTILASEARGKRFLGYSVVYDPYPKPQRIAKTRRARNVLAS